MSKSPKGDKPGERPSDDGKRESWENIDFGWESLGAPPEGAPTLVQKLPGGLEPDPEREPQVTGLRTLEMDRPARGLRTLVEERAPRQTEKDLPAVSVGEKVEEVPAPPSPSEELVAVDPRLDVQGEGSPADSGDWEQRALPVAPPGHRRVARTIVGLGAPDLQALMRAEKIVRSAAAGADVRTDEMPVIVAQTAIEEAVTPRVRRPPAPAPVTNETARRLAVLDEAVTTVEAKADEPAPAPTRGPSVQRLVVPEPGSAVFDDDVVALGPEEVSTIKRPRLEDDAPAPVPREPAPAAAPLAVASATARRAGGREAEPAAAPIIAQPVMPVALPPPSLAQGPAQGPSNLTLAVLWIVAIASVGLAIFLYATRG